MKVQWLLSLAATTLIQSVSAADTATVGSSLSIFDYFIIFFVGIMYLNLFIVGLQRIFRRRIPEKHGSPVLEGLGTLFAFIILGIGSISIIVALFILMAIVAKIAIFDWLVTMLVSYTTFLTFGSPTTRLTAGILLLGAFGFILFLLGIYLIIYIQGNPFYDKRGTPTKLGQPSKFDRDIREELEPLGPTITFKVLDRDRDDPIIDAKVVMKQMNGTRFYTKFTDYNGEVTFKDVEGYGSEYYAYVEGDEKREKFRVFRKKVSGET